jgi:hypothetical protein
MLDDFLGDLKAGSPPDHGQLGHCRTRLGFRETRQSLFGGPPVDPTVDEVVIGHDAASAMTPVRSINSIAGLSCPAIDATNRREMTR